ncbi:MAG TPA: malto-oligosyltrehalose synthase [Patescibacteria group bacterium]|nr:malto-oligosyltrehalose synthase [Patescibacteria group bacterium]
MNPPLTATYRLQLWRDFTFNDAAKLVDYLRGLNISHLYLSPVMESTPGSNHGYDVVDFARVSGERGGEKALLELDRRAKEAGLGIIIDIVPNHMAASCDNPYWRDVLHKGKESEYWHFFDLFVGTDGKIHLPVLGEAFDALVKSGEIALSRQGDSLSMKYGEHCFPLAGEGSDLAQLAEAQHYRLVPWTQTTEHMSYRRFFAVSSLIGLRVEDEPVFARTHEKLFNLKKSLTALGGVRVDHIDGLSRPREYLQRLGQSFDNVWVEKIVDEAEELPDWNVRGTTGYEFIGQVNSLLTNAAGFAALERRWKTYTAAPWPDFATCVRQCKEEVLDTLFPAELRRVAELLAGAPEEIPAATQFLHGLTVCLPVYRTYDFENPADTGYLEEAAAAARDAYGEKWQELGEKYLHALLSPATDKQHAARNAWQQLTGPAMAKGLEDRAHYRYTPLAALNEVGCKPELSAEANDPAEYVRWTQARHVKWPVSLNASSTHDTKRSEDTRARLYALADMPEEWFAFVAAADKATRLFNDPAMRYFFYQAVVGTWPLDDAIDETYRRRLQDYMVKSVHEATLATGWDKPNAAYEKEMAQFIDALLDSADLRQLTSSFCRRLAPAGAVNALAALTLKLLSPAVPDIYQGNEGWDFSLVDPDNRRAVDYAGLAELAADARGLSALREDWHTGAVKLALTRKLLALRRESPFGCADLRISKVEVEGPDADSVVALRLDGGGVSLIVAVPRFAGRYDWDERLARRDGWAGTNLVIGGDQAVEDQLAEETLTSAQFSELSLLFGKFPVAVGKIS